MKKWMSLVVAGCLCLGMVPAMPRETALAAEGDFHSIAGGERHTLVIKDDGSLWGWGRDINGLIVNSRNPKKIMDDVISVSSGNSHAAAIKKDGSLWMWGRNVYGELGDGTKTSRENLQKVMDDVVAVDVGAGHTVVLKKDGTLWTWGWNAYGQLGDGTKDDRKDPMSVMDNVVKIACGHDGHTFAIKSDGSLWAWGRNTHGWLGDGTTENKLSPIKVMDDVKSVSTGNGRAVAIKKDGSLWGCGANWGGYFGSKTKGVQSEFVKVLSGGVKDATVGLDHIAVIKEDNSLWMFGWGGRGQFGDGKVDGGSETHSVKAPDLIKVSDHVSEATAQWAHTAIIKTDGSVWTTGHNGYYQLGDGTKETRWSFVKVLDGARVLDGSEAIEWGEKTPKQPAEELPIADEGYIYDISDPGENVVLPSDMLAQVIDADSAVKVTEATVQGMTEEQKQSATGIDLVTLSAETATARAAAKEVSENEIVINKASVSDLQAVAAQASTAVESALVNGGVTLERVLSKTVTLTSDSLDELSIRIEPDILTAGVDKVRVETPSCALTFKVSDLEADLTKPLTVTLQELGSDTENVPVDTTLAAGVRNFAEGYETVDMGISDISVLANPVKKVKVNFPGGKMTNAVTVSLPSGGGDKIYQAVVKDGGKATASKYNPATTAIDGKINTSGTYSVQTNQKNFSDIANKSEEMQKAIRYLASKGIINGTTETTFSPDQTISRAQIASLMVQALGKMDNSATANFTDVPKNAWYYHQAASSQKHGLFSGYEDNTFRGGNVIQKDQLVNVAGNVLVKEMGYKAPGNPSTYLSKYSDNVAGWAQPMVALATKENLVVYRTNGTFGGKGTMTRGDAAIIIYRLFMKIW